MQLTFTMAVTVIVAMLCFAPNSQAQQVSPTAGPQIAPAPPATHPSKLSQEAIREVVEQMKSRISRCWNPPPGASQSGVTVTLAITLNKDATLRDVQLATISKASNPLSGAIAKSAIRAVKTCAARRPFNLPGDMYAVWGKSNITFDPSILPTDR